MSKILRIAIRIGVAVAVVLLLLYLFGFGRKMIGVWQVERIELTASNGSGISTVELEPKDMRKFIAYYNCSRYAGDVTADRCGHKFTAYIYLKNGEYIAIREDVRDRMVINPSDDERYWADNGALIKYVENLVEDYGLVWEDWGCC